MALLAQIAARKRFSRESARAIRLAAGVSQREIAEELGVDRVTVARWELGTRQPTGELLLRYMHLLNDIALIS